MIKYSNHESRILAALKKSKKPLTSGDLIRVVYPDEDKQPWCARNSVVGALRSLRLKVAENGEPYRIVCSEPRGPRQLAVWMDKGVK